MQPFIEKHQKLIISIIVLFGVFLVGSSVKVFRESRFVGSGLNPTNTITVNGKGELEKSPDTAKVTFSVQSEKKVLKDAQNEVSTKVDAIKKALLAKGVEDRYIKTDSYTSYPQYDYPQTYCSNGVCPRPSAPILRGYQVTHSITVSIKNLDNVESVLGILASNTVTDMQGPNFGFEDDNAVAREARDMAIEDAKKEAQKLADALGVKLVRIVSFNENNGSGYPMAMSARADMAMMGVSKESAPSIPVGTNKVESNVSIVYEIR